MTKKDGEKQIKRDKIGRFAKGKKGGPGRHKKVKSTGRPFEDFITAYEQLGGVAELQRWAAQNNSNRMAFYQMLMRTIPREMIEKLLMKEQTKDDYPLIQYVRYDPPHCFKRVIQLEEFIKSQGLEIPEEPKKASRTENNARKKMDKKG